MNRSKFFQVIGYVVASPILLSLLPAVAMCWLCHAACKTAEQYKNTTAAKGNPMLQQTVTT